MAKRRGQGIPSPGNVRAGGVAGQGSAEYLVLLGAALTVALVVVALLAYYSGTTDEAKKAESDLYWRRAYPLSVLETTGHGEQQILLLKNIADRRVFIRGIDVSNSTGSSLDYGSTLVSYGGGRLQAVSSAALETGCSADQHSILNCSIMLPPGQQIFVQYHLYADHGYGDNGPRGYGNWNGTPPEACGMMEWNYGPGLAKEDTFNSLQKTAYVKNIRIYYSYSAQASPTVESGTADLAITCEDYDFRCGEGNCCKLAYGCVVGCAGYPPGICQDYVT